MAFEFEIGETIIPETPGTQTVTVSGGFTPKVLLIWGASSPVETDRRTSWGMASSSSNMVSIGTFTLHGSTVSDCTSSRSTDLVVFLNGPDLADQAFANLDAFSSGSFTLDWSKVGEDTTGHGLQWIVLGGSGVSQASVSSFIAPNTPAVHNHTDPAFTIGAPDVAIYMTSNFVSGDLFPKERDHAVATLGVATGVNNEWTVGFSSRDAQTTSVAYRANRDDGCVGILDDMSKAWLYRGEHSAFTYASGKGGHDVNWTVTDTTDKVVDVMFIRGGNYYASLEEETSSLPLGLQSITGVGFQPKGVLAASTSDDNTTLSNDGLLTLGAGSTTPDTNVTTWWGDENGETTTNARTIQTSGQMYRPHDNDGLQIGNFDMASVNADGFVVNWDVLGTFPNEWYYLAIGGPEEVIDDRGYNRGLCRGMARGTF